jgi:hypothetical protein
VVPRYVITGLISDSITGGVPDSMVMTIAGHPASISPSGQFIATMDSGPVAVSLTTTGYQTWTRQFDLAADLAFTVHPVRLRPALLLQVIQATAIGAAIFDAQGGLTVSFGNFGSSAFVEGPGFGTVAVSAAWTTQLSSTSDRVVIVAFSDTERPITQITWDLVDTDGNRARFLCAAGSCEELP